MQLTSLKHLRQLQSIHPIEHQNNQQVALLMLPQLRLLSAVVAQIDAEMDARLQAISDTINDPWQAFTMRCHTYLEMALEPEIQRIIMRDSRAVLSDKLTELPTHCVISMSNMIDYLIENKILVESDSKMLALFIYGSLEATALWIANSSDGETQLEQAKSTLDILLNSLRV